MSESVSNLRKSSLRVALAVLTVVFSSLAAIGQQPGNPQDTSPALTERPLAKLVATQPTDTDEYTLGAGDEVNVQIADRPELSGTHLLGPDGRISLPAIGSVSLNGLTRDEAMKAIQTPLLKFYTSAVVDVQITKYGSNRILLMGDVEHPGVLLFDGPPTLLDAVMRGGSVLGIDKSPAGMPKTVILYRDHDKVGIINIQDVFRTGDIRLHKNDLIYVPGDRERLVSVLGEVTRPGPVALRPDSTLVTLLADAGGITPQAGDPMIQVIDYDKHTVQRVSYKDLLKPAGRDITLRPGDIVFIPRSGIAKVGFFLQQLAPAAQIGTIGAVLH